MKCKYYPTLSILAAALGASSAFAGEVTGEVTIDISSLVNSPWAFPGVVNPATFPIGIQNFGGVPLAISSGANNVWYGAVAADSGAGDVSVTVPVGVQGVTSVFTLINAFWSQPGPAAYLYVTFNGSAGATLTVPLIGGVNVRDYNDGSYQDTINNTSTVQVWTNGEGQRLDRQQFILPAEFSTQTLTDVTLTDTGNEYVSRGMFSALTVSTCPAYATEGITVTGSAIVDDPTAEAYVQRVTLTNSSTTTVNGPLFLIVEDLTAGVAVLNKSVPTTCIAPVGSPAVEMLAKGSSLAPNATLNVGLQFTNPAGAPIFYPPLLISSLGEAP